MKVVIAGGSGFLGRPLAAALAGSGCDVVVLTRGRSQPPRPPLRAVQWTPDVPGDTSWHGEIDGADAVVNLAGEPIGGRRWSDAQKQRILESRVRSTRELANAILAVRRPPSVLVNGSAVGYYGPCGDELITEDHPAGSDFLAAVCRQWESEAARAASRTTRVALIRTGLVIEKDGGALAPMLRAFKLALGARIGSGRQYWPWIHRADWISLVRWCLDTSSADGPINATAPVPVTNTAFTASLARALHRPAIMIAPAFALRMLLGEMADGLLLSGQRAVPAKAERLGFVFRYTNLDEALHAVLA
jgi:uncharacterized protein (TIGR01777 family)